MFVFRLLLGSVFVKYDTLLVDSPHKSVVVWSYLNGTIIVGVQVKSVHITTILGICAWWTTSPSKLSVTRNALPWAFYFMTKDLLSSCCLPWASYQIRKIAGCACAGNAGNVFPHHRFQRKPLVSDSGMHHGTCVTHVPCCMSGSLTCGDGENVPGIPGACAPAILRIWQEAHGRRLELSADYPLSDQVALTVMAYRKEHFKVACKKP